MRRSTWIKVGVTALLLGAATAIIVHTASRSSGLFRFVDEVRAEGESLRNREIWMAGVLEPGSHRVRTTRGQRQEHRFRLSHRGIDIEVAYRGTMPQNVKPGLQLVVRGQLDGKGHFLAEEIRTTCPSKYRSEYEARR
ncbi:MAG: cytochrome c maturation protein CcmE [Polyangia bacterium]|jgi:cytochrome c-type biogenesis protein CcmE|nr:cytochrome c maturation protein CcmE [Polyangia bacterium]